MLRREWAPRKMSRMKGLVTDEEVQKIIKYMQNPGYAGVYAFDEEAVAHFSFSGSMKGADQFKAYADRLVIDIDDEDSAQAAQRITLLTEQLEQDGIGYETWFSGGKGYHVVLRHEMIGDINLPYSHKNYVEDVLGVQCDLSIYQHSRILSLPGRIHEKTGKRKAKIEEVPGKLIEFDIVEKPAFHIELKSLGIGDLEAALLNLQHLVFYPPDVGQRHPKLWQYSKDLAKAGVAYESALDIMGLINNQWQQKKTPEEVEAAVKQAYSQV